MHTFKEIIIKHPRVGRLPTLDLQGKWLESLGFITGKTVHMSYQDSTLTLSTTPIGINPTSVLQVTTRFVRNRPRTCLVLDWWLLKRYGIKVGDCVGLCLSQGMIQMTKINRFTVATCA